MKIEAPVGPPPGTQPEVPTPGSTTEAPGVPFGTRLQEAGGTAPAAMPHTGPAATAGPNPADASPLSAHLEALGAELRAGRVHTREQAIGRLVEGVLDAKFGGQVPPEALGPMKNAVAAQLAADPLLGERIDALLRRAQEG